MENKLTEKIILEQENKLYKAIKNANITALAELLHDDLLFILPSGQTITKEDDLDTYRNGALKVDELLPEVENLNIIDDVAVITLTIKLNGKFNELPFEAKFRYIRFWKKSGDKIEVIGGSGIAI
ncbi:nuclear transport factor 2 family protein [Pedobacter rhizosphaerae]|uniref:DUF4440 domain-containing protein n=1 Tax=Pedobacter rhizosphaerae TaxID=390241 RepID=A0A1H9QMK8_9SPHI|nr:nuclear transport factor 2 family protein [Pedobacter rhizosphaerae]SER61811.1 protein of unknown function [Pedobacter rhizosphaerae]